MLNRQPASTASRSRSGGGSSRSGRLLISTATPLRGAGLEDRDRIEAALARASCHRPAGRCSGRGCWCAGRRRRPASAGSSRRSPSPAWNAPMPPPRPAVTSSSGVWSSEPSSRMSTSIPLSSRNEPSRPVRPASTSSCWRSRCAVSPRATVSRGEWSVSAWYSVPSSMAVIAISSIGLPPSLQSEWVCRSPRSACRIGESPPRPAPPAGRRCPLQLDQVLRDLRRPALRRSRWRSPCRCRAARPASPGRLGCRSASPCSSTTSAARRKAFTR